MLLPFHKYQGTGNDFIMVDNRKVDHLRYLTSDKIQRLCDRRFGIGADGLILLGNHDDYDFEMIYFNSDGRESTMCGNGGRCITLFAHELGIKRAKYHFLAIDGMHESQIKNGNIHLKMKDVEVVEIMDDMMVLDTGSPHVVLFLTDLENLDVKTKGAIIRNMPEFQPDGINVNFVEMGIGHQLFVRTYERGVESETLSCGTGVTAASLAAYFKNFKSPIRVTTPGGKLEVRYEKEEKGFSNIYLSGPAERVFQGEIKI